MPQIKQKVIKYIKSPDEDQWLHQQCMTYADIALDQLGYVKYETQVLENPNLILYMCLFQDTVFVANILAGLVSHLTKFECEELTTFYDYDFCRSTGCSKFKISIFSLLAYRPVEE